MSSFICLSLCFFDGNSSMFKMKSDMAKPKDFMPTLIGAYATFAALLCALSTISFLAFGQQMNTILVNSIADKELLFNAIKISSIIAILIAFINT